MWLRVYDESRGTIASVPLVPSCPLLILLTSDPRPSSGQLIPSATYMPPDAPGNLCRQLRGKIARRVGRVTAAQLSLP